MYEDSDDDGIFPGNCFNCGEYGHRRANCTIPRRKPAPPTDEYLAAKRSLLAAPIEPDPRDLAARQVAESRARRDTAA